MTDLARLYHTIFDREMQRRGLNRSEWWLISILCCETDQAIARSLLALTIPQQKVLLGLLAKIRKGMQRMEQ